MFFFTSNILKRRLSTLSSVSSFKSNSNDIKVKCISKEKSFAISGSKTEHALIRPSRRWEKGCRITRFIKGFLLRVLLLSRTNIKNLKRSPRTLELRIKWGLLFIKGVITPCQFPADDRALVVLRVASQNTHNITAVKWSLVDYKYHSTQRKWAGRRETLGRLRSKAKLSEVDSDIECSTLYAVAKYEKNISRKGNESANNYIVFKGEWRVPEMGRSVRLIRIRKVRSLHRYSVWSSSVSHLVHDQ